MQNLNTLGQEEARITQEIQSLATSGIEQTKKDIGK